MAIPYSSVRRGPNALVRTYGPGGAISVSRGRPTNPNVRYTYGSPGDYAGYAAAQKAAAKKAPAAGSKVGTALQGGTAAAGTPAAQALASNPFMTDPGYLSALAAEQTGVQQADNALRAAQEQAIVQFGDPSLAQAAGLNVNPLTAQAAQANTQAGTSTVAGYQRSRDVNQQNILDQLAAHGALDSGQTGYATLQNQQAYGRDVAGGLQTALAGLNTAAATDVSTKQGLRSDVTSALLGAYQTYTQNPQYWGAATGGQVAAANALATQPATPTAAGPAPRTPITPATPAAKPPPGFIRSGYGFVPAGRAPVAGALARSAIRPQTTRNVRAG